MQSLSAQFYTTLVVYVTISDEIGSTVKKYLWLRLESIAIRVDPETLSWFQSKGEEAEQHMSAALRIYAEAQKNVADMHRSA
jgi:uncharacterized protein (DUF4415 family)